MASKFQRMICDGKVAVLYAPGRGNGWSTWNPECSGLLYDRDIVRAVLSGDTTRAMTIAKTKYPAACVFGGASLQVAWVPEGEHFVIDETDGERVVVLNADYGQVA